MKHIVSIDPDGLGDEALFLLVRSDSGVIYRHQCGGVVCDQKQCEGFLIPIGGLGLNSKMKIDPSEFIRPFHDGKSCVWGGSGQLLKESRLQQLENLVHNLPVWVTNEDEQDRLTSLRLNIQRLDELREGWIPVISEYGDGYLITPNCD